METKSQGSQLTGFRRASQVPVGGRQQLRLLLLWRRQLEEGGSARAALQGKELERSPRR